MIILMPVKEIKTLLFNDLINSTFVIDNAYDWLQDYFAFQYQVSTVLDRNNVLMDKSILSSSFDIIKNNPVRTIGIDFPVLLSKGESRPVMMVCAMDPLRNDTVDKKTSNKIGYWVPFSIINNPAGQTKHSEKENLAFFHTLLDTYDLYVTDIFKLFYRQENRVSNTISEFRTLPVHRAILDAEIQIIKPSVILTLGNNARDAISELLNLPRPKWTDEIYTTKAKNGIEVVMVPHISGAANGSKAPILKNTIYADVSGKNNVKYAQIIVKTLNT
jgi:hypothetical protein